MEVNHQMLHVARVLIRRLYINETGGITSLFRLNVVKDCTLVSLNHALLRLIITPVSLDITQVSLHVNNAPVTLCLRLGLKGGNSNVIQHGNRSFRLQVDAPTSRSFRLHGLSRFAYIKVDSPSLILIIK